jgi:phosphoserine phosphatase
MTTDAVIQAWKFEPSHIEIFANAIGRGPDASGQRWARFSDVSESPQLRDIAHSQRIDLAFVPTGLHIRDFRVLAMDMDSTLITIECIDEMARVHGVGDQVVAITEAAMRGELDFPGALRKRVSLLAGLPVSSLVEIYEAKLQLSPGAETLVSTCHAAGIKTLLVSGGFTFFTDRLRRRLGLTATLANELEIRTGRLTGNVLGDIVDGELKRRTLETFCAAHGASAHQAMAIGDGANDIPMLSTSRVGIAYRAKPKVQASTRYALNFSGLDGALALLEG